MIPRSVWRDDRLNACDFRVLCALQGRAFRIKGKRCAWEPVRATVADLAASIGKHERRVQSSIRHLESFGLVKVQKWPGRGRPNAYDLNPAWREMGDELQHPLETGMGDTLQHPLHEKGCRSTAPITGEMGDGPQHPQGLQITDIPEQGRQIANPASVLHVEGNGDGHGNDNGNDREPRHPQAGHRDMDDAHNCAQRMGISQAAFIEGMESRTDLTADEILHCVTRLMERSGGKVTDASWLAWIARERGFSKQGQPGGAGTMSQDGRVNWGSGPTRRIPEL